MYLCEAFYNTIRNRNLLMPTYSAAALPSCQPIAIKIADTINTNLTISVSFAVLILLVSFLYNIFFIILCNNIVYVKIRKRPLIKKVFSEILLASSIFST